MNQYAIKITDKLGYAALSSRTRRLFDADMPKLARDPFHPVGLNVSPMGRDGWVATVADGEVIIRYRVIEKTVEVSIHTVRAL